jgi:hypothetical protein
MWWGHRGGLCLQIGPGLGPEGPIILQIGPKCKGSGAFKASYRTGPLVQPSNQPTRQNTQPPPSHPTKHPSPQVGRFDTQVGGFEPHRGFREFADAAGLSIVQNALRATVVPQEVRHWKIFTSKFASSYWSNGWYCFFFRKVPKILGLRPKSLLFA